VDAAENKVFRTLKFVHFLRFLTISIPGKSERGEMSSFKSKARLDSALGQDEFRRKKYLC